MANKISTVRTYPLNGAVDFTITFEYLARKFVKVTLIGKDRKELVLNQDYRFTTKTQITTSRAWTDADGYQMIEIRRFTSASDRLVDFADGSILRAYDLNISQIQTLHVAEEARDLTADTIGVNNDGHLDARGRRIVNVADPVGEYDALNLRTVKQWNDGAYQSYVKARTEADRAKSEADRAQQEATKANNFAVHSEQYGIRSESAAVSSEAARDRAISAESNAASSASDALTSEGQAAAHNEAARQSRIKAEEARDRAIVEADKLESMNDFAGALDSVDGNHVAFKGNIATPGNIVGGGITSTGAGQFDKGVSIGDLLVVGGDIQAQKDILVDGIVVANGGLRQQSNGNAYNSMWRLHIKNSPMHIGLQGLHFAWNEQSSGEANFICNKGLGDGGFVFRTVNSGNTAELGRVTFTGNGEVHARHFQGENGARIEAGNNIIGQIIYSGMGRCHFNYEGNLRGGLWDNYGGDLYNFLHNKYQFAKPPGGVQLYTGRGGDYIEGTVDGSAVGFRWFSSDRRLKEDLKVVRDADDMLNIIRSYIPVSYKYKDKTWTDNHGRSVKTVGKRSRAGFITQDLIRLWPEAVDVMSDGMQSPDPNQIIGGLMLLVKNLDARIQELEKDKE
ncbi:tail fiber protein [Shigella phage VB_Ship_A7]|uniref:Tail fiber protein n=1 Tax=Shigella phage VB_Ship_A7 TaxID=2562138 RepID=A0A4D6DRN9_9CAUD|nr:tail fiber protein [Shigella phage VB_Ship_A7]QBZ68983.1 tail fiber protein [Shigella phage VB_Ship_A7]